MKALIPCLLLLASLPASARTLGSLEFSDCDLGAPGTGATTPAQCARLDVPEDPSRPDGRRISLLVGWLPARASEPEPDPVVYVAGGPGQAASESWSGIAGGFAEILAKRHVLFVDQRGTGGSNKLGCAFPDAVDEMAEPAPDQLRKLAQDCLAGLDADPAMYTTSVATGDLEAVRLAIGAPKLNVYGGSYGTRFAQQYARQYPDAVRSLVLDGIVPPGLALGSEHSRNLDEALEALLAACRDDAACRAAHGDPYAALYRLRDQARAAPRTLQLRDPKTNQPRELALNEVAVATVARMFAYQPEAAALLPLFISEALAGRPESLVAQALLVYDGLKEQITHGMQLSVICAEDADRLSENAADAERLLGNALVGVTTSQCAVWPKGPVAEGFHEPLRTDLPVLLLSGEFDPVTPPRYGEQVLADLGKARHLVGKGQGHILLPRGCTPRLAARFLDSLDPAGLDAACLDSLGPTPFFLDYNGAAP